jgi:hypothetical protein
MVKLKQWLALIAILAGIAAMASLVPSQAARPGGGGSVPAGKIYFTWSIQSPNYEPLGWWSMNADGSSKQLLDYQPSQLSPGAGTTNSDQLSHLVHQGHRWFLENRSSPTALGEALFAVRDDGDPDFVVLLADAAPAGLHLQHVRWSKDDSFLSIAAMPEIIFPGGSIGIDPDALDRLYAASIAFDPDTGLPALTTPLVIVAEGVLRGQTDIRSHDWSPYNDEIVYQLTGNPGQTFAMIVDLVTGTPRLFAADAWTPVWSPDGTRIAYWVGVGNEGVYVSKPDGTALLQITTSNNNHYDQTAGWSLDSQHVLVIRNTIKTIKGGGVEYLSDVMRVPASGGTIVNLTKDIGGQARAVYWR